MGNVYIFYHCGGGGGEAKKVGERERSKSKERDMQETDRVQLN